MSEKPLAFEKKLCDEQRHQQPLFSCLLSLPNGFSLIELIMIIVILSFLTAIMVPFIQSFLRSPDPMFRQQAISIGQALMDEIISKKWDENTPVGGGPVRTSESPSGSRGLLAGDPQASTITGTAEEASRPVYDDIDDYDGFSETDDFYDQTGNLAVSLSGFSRSAAVTYIASNTTTIQAATPAGTTAGGELNATDTKRVVVTVTSPLGETFTFIAVACNL